VFFVSVLCVFFIVQNGSDSVSCQDLNQSVIRHATVPNFNLNFSDISRAHFYFGDWRHRNMGKVLTESMCVPFTYVSSSLVVRWSI